MSEREFWIAVRAAMLLFVDAIEHYQHLGKYAPPKVVTVQEGESIAG